MSSAADTLVVNEIFHSLQGESSHTGRPCVFVRLTACNLRCTYCDTEYAFHEGRAMTLSEIHRAVDAFPARLVEVTGGEPLLQPNALVLMRELADRGKTVMLETGGALDVSGVDPRVRKIVDVKCPSSGESLRNHWPNLERLGPGDEVKFVIGDRADFDWARDVIATRLGSFAGAVLFSPVHGRLAPRDLAGWVLASGLDVRVQIQLHKYIWPEAMRGV